MQEVVWQMNDLQIEYFLAVAENLSFTKTAAEKYVSQPAISKQITSMEEELGVVLFERGRKSTQLTEAGNLLAEYYRRQRTELALLSRQMKEMEGNKYIPLRIAFGSGWTLSHFMPDIIKKVQAVIPTAKIMLVCNELLNLETMLLKNHADLIISIDINIHQTPNIEIRPLANIPGLLIYSRNHPLAGSVNAPAGFRNEVFLVPMAREIDFIINLVNSFVEPYGFTPKIFKVDNVGSMIANVKNGIGVAIVDEWIIDKNEQDILTIPIDTAYPIVAAWKKGNDNPALTVFLDELFKLPHEDLL